MIYKSKTHKYKIKIHRMPNVYYWEEKAICIYKKEIGWRNFLQIWKQTNTWFNGEKENLVRAEKSIQQMIEQDNINL